MIGRFSRTTLPLSLAKGWLVFAIVSLITGCRQQYKEGVDVLAFSPDLQTLPIPSDYASGAIVATGGLQEWVKAAKLELDGVVTLYQSDGSVYLTEQHYEIYPWSNAIRVSAVEPQGELPALLNGSDEGPAMAGVERVRRAGVDAPRQEHSGISERDLADAILTITTASVRFLDREASFTNASEPVKMQGLWYYPIERAYVVDRPTTASGRRRDVEAPLPYWSEVSSFAVPKRRTDTTFDGQLRRMEVFYQNRDNSLVDLVWFADVEACPTDKPLGRREGKFFAVRGYDYSRVQKRGVLLPAKIEIFRTDARGALSERVAQVNFE